MLLFFLHQANTKIRQNSIACLNQGFSWCTCHVSSGWKTELQQRPRRDSRWFVAGSPHNSRPRRPVVWIMPRTIRWFEAHVFTVVVTVPASLSSSPAMPCLHRYQFQLRSQRTGVQPSLPVLHTSRRCSAVASRCRCGPRMTQSVSLPRLPLPTARASRVGRR